MSLYNMLFGQNEKADVILATLGLTKADVGRYRDVYLNNGEIVVHTRNGGGNREYYQDVFDELSDHPCYLRDDDDDFDCTYANIYFSYPEEYAAELRAIEANTPIVTPSEKWQALFAAMSALTPTETAKE